MSRSSGSQKATFRLTVKLDYEQDSEVVRWLESHPVGHRSEAVREVLREHVSGRQESIGEAIRAVIADELTKALAALSFDIPSQGEQKTTDLEQRFGDRLDQMLGGLDRNNRE